MFISPQYLCPHDQAWRIGGAVENPMLVEKEFFRPAPVGDNRIAGFADWLAKYKPFIKDGKTVVVIPQKLCGGLRQWTLSRGFAIAALGE